MIRGLARLGQHIVLALREDLFDHLTLAVAALLLEQKAGWIIARLTSDVDALSDVLSQGLTTLVVNTLTLIAAIVGLFVLDWRLGLVALVILPPTLVLTRWFQVRSHAAFLRVRETISAMTAQIAESVVGHGRDPGVQPRARVPRRVRQRERGEPADEHARAVAQLALLPGDRVPRRRRDGRRCSGSAASCSARARSTIGTLVSSVFLLNLVFQPLQELSDLYGQVQSAGAAMEKITTVLDTEPEIRDAPERDAAAPRIDGDLHLDHVTFAYGREPVLHAIDIHVPPGGCLALVGESGGGKSTTAKLVGRFYDPDEGAVLVDGHDLRERRAARVPPPARRRAPGPVPLRGNDRRQHPLRAAGARPTSRSRTSRTRSASTGSRAASRAGCCTRYARAAQGSRPASGS